MTTPELHDLCARFCDNLSAIPLEGAEYDLAIVVGRIVEDLRDSGYYPDDSRQLADALREARTETQRARADLEVHA